MMMFKIGIDIGGTNTDAVLINADNKIINSAKTPTTSNVADGFKNALLDVVNDHKKDSIAGIFVGTTHGINSLLEVNNLNKVGIIRLAGYYPNIIPPCYNWPQKLKNSIYIDERTVAGGYECNGTPITNLCKKKIIQAAKELVKQGAEGLVITGIFSFLYSMQEIKAKQWIFEELPPNFPITLSHEVGGAGLIERENAAILNIALQKSLTRGFRDLQKILKIINLSCPLFITQNNGTLSTLEQAHQFPIFTLAAGPKNSFIGAAKLAGLQNAIVADIGGTSTDFGAIVNGFTRRTYKNAKLEGISLGFSMPDTISIPLGGGSKISASKKCISIGPLSVGRSLMQKAKSFGGNHLTLTDAAIAFGTISFPNITISMDKDLAQKTLQETCKQIEYYYRRLAGPKDIPLILVGGGAALLPNELLSDYMAKNTLLPQHGTNANAYGAALAEIGATMNSVIGLGDRKTALRKLEKETLRKAKQQGAKNPRIIEKRIIPYHYIPGNLARVIITAAGAF